MFFTGQVDTFATKDHLHIRQRGFQETDIVSMAAPVTKYSVRVDRAEDIKYELQKAYFMATSGHKGPVLIDLPADVQRAMVATDALREFTSQPLESSCDITQVVELISRAKRPVILAGAGINQAGAKEELKQFCERYHLPVLTSMPAYDVLPYHHPLHNGFIGVNGHRYANLLLAKADLVICLASRLDIKQIGLARQLFNPKAQLIRVDIDPHELNYAVANEELRCQADVKTFLRELLSHTFSFTQRDATWNNFAQNLKSKLEFVNDTEPAHAFMRKISRILPQEVSYTLDVGQNEVWAVQSLELKQGQRIYMSAGLGTMGYALPAAIGVYYATKKPVIAFVGDGGIQMSIQELQFLALHKLPVNLVLFNNEALGMIRQFQEKNFQANYVNTTVESGYANPDFKKLANAYHFKYACITQPAQLKRGLFDLSAPKIIEVKLPAKTLLLPYFGKEIIFDQQPQIDRKLYEEIMGY